MIRGTMGLGPLINAILVNSIPSRGKESFLCSDKAKSVALVTQHTPVWIEFGLNSKPFA